jgi:hypothetical protein
VGHQSLLISDFSRHRLNPFSVILTHRPFAQVLCDFSFRTTALSTPANPGHNDLDEQETGDEGQNQEQIKIFFRHCPWLSVKEIEQCLGPTKGKENCAD